MSERRKRGVGSIRSERKSLKTQGLAYTNYKNIEQPAKLRPSENEWEEIQVLKKGKNKNEPSAVMLNEIDTINRITKEKLKNLEDMIPYLPQEHHAYYEDLIKKHA